MADRIEEIRKDLKHGLVDTNNVVWLLERIEVLRKTSMNALWDQETAHLVKIGDLQAKLDEVTANLADAEDTIAWQRYKLDQIREWSNKYGGEIHNVRGDGECYGACWGCELRGILDTPTQKAKFCAICADDVDYSKTPEAHPDYDHPLQAPTQQKEKP